MLIDKREEASGLRERRCWNELEGKVFVEVVEIREWGVEIQLEPERNCSPEVSQD